jgi:hypothetical protein
VVEHQIDVIVLVADGDSLLARLKAETAAEFEQEPLYVIEECRLQITFRIAGLFGETDEFKYIWIADQLGDLDAGSGCLPSCSFDDCLLVQGQPRALIEQGANLPLKLAFRPGALQAFVFVKCPFPRVLKPDEFNKVGPRQAQERLPPERRRQPVSDFVTAGDEISIWSVGAEDVPDSVANSDEPFSPNWG